MAEAKTDSGYTPGSYNPDYVGSSGLTNQQVIDNFRAAMAKSRSTPASTTVNTGGGGGMMSSQSTGGGFSGQPTTLQGAYGTFLGRAPDPEGLSYWKGQVESGNLSLSQAINAIGSSPEASTFQAGGGLSGQLGGVYTGYLGREADPTGLEYWTGQIGSGMLTPEQVQREIMTSQEALDLQYDDPVQQAVADMYNDVFGRAPKMDEGGGLEFWAGEVRQAAGEQPTEEALQTALASVESSLQRSPENVTQQVGKLYSDIFGAPLDPSFQQQLVQDVETQLQSGVGLNDALSTVQFNLTASKNLQTPFEARELNLDQLVTEATAGNVGGLGQFFYEARKDNSKLDSAILEELALSRSQDPDTAYNYLVGAQAYAEGIEARDKAISENNTEQAQLIQQQLMTPESFFDFYLGNPEIFGGDQAAVNLRKETATGPIFGIDDPKGGVKGTITRGITRLGDAIGDVAENRFVQAAVAMIPGVGPPLAAVVNAYGTLDSGDELSPVQIAATLAGISELSQLEGGVLLSKLPEPVQNFIQAARDFANGLEARAVAALKYAFPNVDTEQLAKIEDNLRIAVEEITKEEKPKETIIPKEELMADSAYFNRLFQPGLPVDTSFLVEEPSLAQQLLVDRTG